MKKNSALFLKALIDQDIPYSLKNTVFENIYTFDMDFMQHTAQVSVALFNDDSGLRITVSDYFSFDHEDMDKVLDIINEACAERRFFTAYAAEDEVFLRKELPASEGFSPESLFSVLEVIRLTGQELLDKLCLIYTVLS